MAALAAAPSVAAGEPAVALPAVTDRGWQLDLTGYVQADAVAWSEASVDELDPSTGEPLNEDRFLIRRARLRAEAHRGGLSAALELDGNTQHGATARLLGAQVGWTFAAVDALEVSATIGLLKIPFGAEVPASERDKPFLEPPAMSRALFPGNYDAGAMLHGRYGLARWSIALMNGAPVGDAQWRGQDPSASYDVVGRLGADLAAPGGLRLVVGVSALSGSGLHPGTRPTKDDIQWVDDNQNGRVDDTEIQIVPGSPGTPSQAFTHDALGADVQVHWCVCAIGDGTAFFETALATNLDRGVIYSDPIATSRDLRQLGLAIGAVQELGEHVQVGARYDRYDADRDARDREGAELINVHKVFSTVAVMASGRWDDARLTVEYDHERNPFGRGDDGAPVTRAADRVTIRAQVGF